MALTLRNVVNRTLDFYEFDGNLQFAEQKALEAQAARDAAILFANVFDSTALGIAGTTNGQYFAVPGTGGVYLYLYKNVSGVATLSATLNAFVGGTLTGSLNEAPPVTIASAANIDIGAAASNTVIISGTAAITSLGTIAAGAIRYLRATGAFTLTHNATSLILQGSNIVAAVGDVFRFESLGAGNWRLTGFQSGSAPAAYQPLDATLTSISAAGTAADKMLYTTGVDTWAEAAITAAGRSLVAGASASAQLTTLGTTAFNTFVSADQTITLAGALTLAHGLGAVPRAVKLALVCQTGELGYTAGDVLMDVSARTICAVVVDATNLNIRMLDSANVGITNKSTGVRAAFTVANWKLRFIAIK